MADSKISDLTELTTPANDDLFVIVDTSAAETKKIQKINIGGGFGDINELLNDTSWFVPRTFDVTGSPITLPATSEPGTATISYTVVSGDILNPAWGVVDKYGFCFSIVYKDLSSHSARTVHAVMCVNDVDVSTFDFSTSLYANYAQIAGYAMGTNLDVQVGDVIGIKIWCDTTLDAEVDYYAFMLLPAKLHPTANIVCFFPTNETGGDGLVLPKFSTALSLTEDTSSKLRIAYGNLFEFGELDANSIGQNSHSKAFKNEPILALGSSDTPDFDAIASSNDGEATPQIIDLYLSGFEKIRYWV